MRANILVFYLTSNHKKYNFVATCQMHFMDTDTLSVFYPFIYRSMHRRMSVIVNLVPYLTTIAFISYYDEHD